MEDKILELLNSKDASYSVEEIESHLDRISRRFKRIIKSIK